MGDRPHTQAWPPLLRMTAIARSDLVFPFRVNYPAIEITARMLQPHQTTGGDRATNIYRTPCVKAHIAVSSIPRDWVKGQVSAIETGVLSFEAVFMPFMLTNDGRPMIEQVQHLLPAPAEQKVVSLPKPAA